MTEREDEAPVTGEEWELEIEHAVRGSRDAEIQRLGSVGEYFEVLIESADDTALASVRFRTALEHWVHYWHPHPISHAAETVRALDLLQWFTPPEGAERALELLSDWPPADLAVTNPLPPPENLDLYLRALRVLEQHFSAPPARITPAFTAYLEVLDAALDNPDYQQHALTRLFALKVIQEESETIGALLARHRSALPVLLKMIFALGSRRRTEAALTNVYAHCIARSLLIDFEIAIGRLGGDVKANRRVVIVKYGGDVYRLELAKAQLATTWNLSSSVIGPQLDLAIQRGERMNDDHGYT